MVHKYTQMQIIGRGESTPNADYLKGQIYTKCRLLEGVNLHQMQIIGEAGAGVHPLRVPAP